LLTLFRAAEWKNPARLSIELPANHSVDECRQIHIPFRAILLDKHLMHEYKLYTSFISELNLTFQEKLLVLLHDNLIMKYKQATYALAQRYGSLISLLV